MSVPIVAPITLGNNALVYQNQTLLNNTLAARTIYTCPAQCEAIINYIYVSNADNVARNVSIVVWNSVPQPKIFLFDNAIGAVSGAICPNTVTSIRNIAGGVKIILVPGDYVVITWAAGGASTGGSAEINGDIREYAI